MRYDFVIVGAGSAGGYLLPGYPKTLPDPFCSWRPVRTIRSSNSYPTS